MDIEEGHKERMPGDRVTESERQEEAYLLRDDAV